MTCVLQKELLTVKTPQRMITALCRSTERYGVFQLIVLVLDCFGSLPLLSCCLPTTGSFVKRKRSETNSTLSSQQ